jgi:aspartate kinase
LKFKNTVYYLLSLIIIEKFETYNQKLLIINTYQMKVFKFGGASINSVDRFKNTANIISGFQHQKILIVVSAMGKTTNSLEKVVENFCSENSEVAHELFEHLKNNHLDILKYLITKDWQKATTQLKDLFTEVEWLLHDKPVRNYDYYYDQMVCCGELMSSSLLYHFLLESNIKAHWLDARDIIKTDNNFRDANINWEVTNANVQEIILPLFEHHDIIITQGFIGSTDENESVTLGREGSDYTAAVFANLLNSESVTIWKDVDGVMNADPKKIKAAAILHSLSYSEVIEMAYYGAQVIHPKTIKPLQNKNIPLFVKSFIHPTLEGTEISKVQSKNLPPIIVNKENQVLIEFKSKDFSFVEGTPMQFLHELCKDIKINPNITQNTAISILCCFDLHEEKLNLLAEKASEIFDVSLEKNLELITIRHYNQESIEKYVSNKLVLLEQKTTQTIQVVVR